jgi:hypothetical protein
LRGRCCWRHQVRAVKRGELQGPAGGAGDRLRSVDDRVPVSISIDEKTTRKVMN